MMAVRPVVAVAVVAAAVAVAVVAAAVVAVAAVAAAVAVVVAAAVVVVAAAQQAVVQQAVVQQAVVQQAVVQQAVVQQAAVQQVAVQQVAESEPAGSEPAERRAAAWIRKSHRKRSARPRLRRQLTQPETFAVSSEPLCALFFVRDGQQQCAFLTLGAAGCITCLRDARLLYEIATTPRSVGATDVVSTGRKTVSHSSTRDSIALPAAGGEKVWSASGRSCRVSAGRSSRPRQRGSAAA
jgi:hypothetical protein